MGELNPLFANLSQLDQSQRNGIAHNLDQVQAQVGHDEDLGDGRHDLATLLGCVAAYFRGEPVPPIPSRYVSEWVRWTDDG